MPFTADDARRAQGDDLDQRIEHAVRERRHGSNGAYLRVYHDDPWVHSIMGELMDRGFKNVDVPHITLKGDVYFEWDED